MSRLRAGELVAGLGGVGLFVLLFLDWFRSELDYGPVSGGTSGVETFTPGASGWSVLGWFMVVLLCVQMLGAAALVYMTIRRASPAWPIGAGVLTWIVGSAIWLVLLVRVCIAQPGPDALMAVKWPAYLGLLCSALIPIGGLLSIKDERKRTPESLAYTPPPARTAPGA